MDDTSDTHAHTDQAASTRFSVEQPLQYRTRRPPPSVRRADFTAVEEQFPTPSEKAVPAAGTHAVAKRPEKGEPLAGTLAVVVAHGMGQQIPFETLDSVVNGLQRVEAGLQGVPMKNLPKPTARVVRVGDKRLDRLELTLSGKKVHVYEAYWAPLTEGHVTLRDVVAFLATGALNGIRRGLGPFHRWLFGRFAAFGSKPQTAFDLVTALVVLCSLITMNTIIIAVAAARAPLSDPPQWLTKKLFADFTVTLSAYVVLALLVGGLLGLAVSWRRGRSVLRPVIWTLFVATLLGTVAAAWVLVLLVWCHAQKRVGAPDRGFMLEQLGIAGSGFQLVVAGLFVAAVVVAVAWSVCVLRDSMPRLGAARIIAAVVGALLVGYLTWRIGGSAIATADLSLDSWPLLAWPVFLGISLIVRKVVLEFLGDVAVYVASHRLDKFHDLRERIRTVVFDTVHAVYAATDTKGAGYAKVAVVGHSLGSVIAYDALNRLIVDDESAPASSLDTAGRTAGLLTFGSPLDKTAFVFGTQGEARDLTPCPPAPGTLAALRGAPPPDCPLSEGREALAAARQPLIRDYARFRLFPWINVYSPDDIISGRLDFYDDPLRAPPPLAFRVANERDPDANIPLYAHVMYWQNCLVWRRLYGFLT